MILFTFLSNLHMNARKNARRAARETFLVVPGLHNSGSAHWQTWFEQVVPHSRRVNQPDWETPHLPSWAFPVQQALGTLSTPAWIVAHSFGCLAAVVAASLLPHTVKGALLVAPADPERFQIPARILAAPLPFPTRVVASSNDPWVSLASARLWAQTWGSDFINVGPLGHINADSGHGPWPEVLTHLEELQDRHPLAQISNNV
jgi:predicted alpha/beta hydrolase family esterase